MKKTTKTILAISSLIISTQTFASSGSKRPPLEYSSDTLSQTSASSGSKRPPLINTISSSTPELASSGSKRPPAPH
jgi:hypothetical protein